MFGFDPQHTHYNPNEHLLIGTNIPKLALYWNKPIGNKSYIESSPTVVNGIVYIGSYDRNLYAYSTAGTFLWKYPTPYSLNATPTIIGNQLYLAPDQSSSLYVLDARKGTLLWQDTFNVAGDKITYSSPLVVNGMVYEGSADGYLYVFNADGCSNSTCTPVHEVSLDPNVPLGTGARIDSSPTFYNNTLYVTATNSNNNLYAVNASTFQIEWSASLAGNSQSTPAIDSNGMLYVGSATNQLFAFNANGCNGAATCQPAWSVPLSAGSNTSPAVANDMVYIGTTDGVFHAISTTLHQPVWSYQTGIDIDTSSATIANGLVYIGSDDGNLYAFNANGCSGQQTCAPLRSLQTGGAIHSSPAVVDGVVYVGSEDDYLYAFHLHY